MQILRGLVSSRLEVNLVEKKKKLQTFINICQALAMGGQCATAICLVASNLGSILLSIHSSLS